MRFNWLVIVTIWSCFYYPLILSAAPKPVEVMRVSVGHRGFVRVILRVEPHEGNRKVCLTWYPEEEEDFPSKSCRDVEGTAAPITYTYEKTLPHGGLWYFKGVVERNTGRVVSAPKPALIPGR